MNYLNSGVFDKYCYSYGYNVAGNVTSQKMRVSSGNTMWSGVGRLSMASTYQWDDEGRMTSQTAPGYMNMTYNYPSTGIMGGSRGRWTRWLGRRRRIATMGGTG